MRRKDRKKIAQFEYQLLTETMFIITMTLFIILATITFYVISEIIRNNPFGV